MRPVSASRAALRAFPVLLLLGGCDYDHKVGPGGPGAQVTPDAQIVTDTQVADTQVTDTQTNPPDTQLPPDTTPPTPPEWQHPEVVGVELGKGEDTPLDPLTPAPETRTRGRARLDIDQIDGAFKTVLGGISWTRRVGSNDVNQFQALSETLGVPDFIDTTVEDLAATPLFSKFLGDASRKACADRLAADLAAPTGRILLGDLPVDATLSTHPDAIEAQISALLLRFHGRLLRPTDAGFGEWRWLFESSTQLTGQPTIAWQAMCVALITHPDFYTY